MIKNIFVSILLVLLLPSCAFLFYNYRGYLKTEFTIENKSTDTTVRYRVGAMIYRLSAKENFYTRYVSPTNDSLDFYGPDYHTFSFRISEDHNTTKVYFRYFGYHGLRSKPPHKLFIQNLTDSLKLTFGATQLIIAEGSNEKIN